MTPKVANLEGRPHLIVPVVMGTAGVWNGSKGPLYYPSDELSRSAHLWNGRPCVIYHPSMQADGIAGHPEIFTRQKVGTIFNAHFDPQTKSLKAECWLDPARLAAVDPRVLSAVRAGRMVEVSTGLFTDNEGPGGTFNGAPYVAIARDHRPDHLAILPDQEGACSIRMGAGLCRNAFDGEEPLLLPSMLVA